MVRIALPSKGRLAEDVRRLFTDAGFDARAGERALSIPLGDGLEALLVRAQDVPEFVADGAADAGVTGHDLVCESGRDLVELLDLQLGSCRLVLAAPEGVTRLAPGTRVATSFPRLARRLLKERGLDIEVVPVSGAAEVAPRLGIAEAIVDLVSTGSTLRVNGLSEIDVLLFSSGRLVTRAGLPAETARALESLALTLGSVVRARGSRYLMANAPRAELDRVREVLPGISGPTIIELLRGGDLVAVHAVVPAAAVPLTVRELKGIGCQGILVTRVERMVP